jgi:PPK2 family polyphosphate:nucleotide phosphotransferase
MKKSEIIDRSHEFAEPYCITDGKKFRLKDVDPAEMGKATPGDKPRAKELLETGIQALAELQDVLYAQDRWSVLLIFQAMDAAGKDGAIKHVMSGVNPQGCQVYSFKSPSAEDLNHDYLWRCMKCLPERGRIGIFNRSYYEETLVVRVHPELLAKQKIPQQLVTKDIWEERYQDIRKFERYLARNGVVIRKFFLHVSGEEQKKRFLERLDNAAKNWKFSGYGLPRARLLDGIHGDLRGYDPQHGDRLRAVVCGARRQQVVYPGRRRGGCHRRTRITGPPVSRSHRRTSQAARCGEGSTDRGRRTLKSDSTKP